MYSYIPLGLNQLLNVGVDQWLQFSMLGICKWVHIFTEINFHCYGRVDIYSVLTNILIVIRRLLVWFCWSQSPIMLNWQTDAPWRAPPWDGSIANGEPLLWSCLSPLTDMHRSVQRHIIAHCPARLENLKPESHGFETSRDIAARLPSTQWIEVHGSFDWMGSAK